MKKLIFSAFACTLVLAAWGQPTLSTGEKIDFKPGKNNYLRTYTSPEVNYLTVKSLNLGWQYSAYAFEKNFMGFSEEKIEVQTNMQPKVIFNGEGFLPTINGMYFLHTELDKNIKQVRGYVSKINKAGKLDAEKTAVGANYNYEKALKTGYINAGSSPDGKRVAIVETLPTVKDSGDKYITTVYDENWKQLSQASIRVTDEDNYYSHRVSVNNNGEVYLTTWVLENSQNEKTRVTYFPSNNGTPKTNLITLEAPHKLRGSETVFTPDGKFIIAGFYSDDKKVFTGEKKCNGAWFLQINNGELGSIVLSTFDAPLENAEVKSLLQNGDTYFLTGEKYKEIKGAPKGPPGSAAQMDYTYTYLRGDIMVVGFTETGEKKFSILANKSNQTNDIDLSNTFYPTISGGKLVLFFNDDLSKYVQTSESYRKTSVVVTVTNDGLYEAPIRIVNKEKPKSYFAVLPGTGMPLEGNSAFFVGYENYEYYSMKVTW